ncbi:MAG: hypothetical protein GF364_19000 [Candidatus Lokiarchaeota archaeon]|nr:hypothetical protein [Candidatus Lokiarchaeota archaeon]
MMLDILDLRQAERHAEREWERAAEIDPFSDTAEYAFHEWQDATKRVVIHERRITMRGNECYYEDTWRRSGHGSLLDIKARCLSDLYFEKMDERRTAGLSTPTCLDARPIRDHIKVRNEY